MFGQTLRQKTERALGAFRSVVEDLSRINVEAEEKTHNLTNKIASLESEKNELESLIVENDRTIEKISKLLS